MKIERVGKRVVVRPYKASDYRAWKTSFSSVDPIPKNTWDITLRRKKSIMTLAAFRKILNQQKRNRNDDYFFDLGIFLKDGTLVGGVSIMDISRGAFQSAYLGYRVNNNHWGKGYGKEGVSLAVDIAFKNLKLHRLEAAIEKENKRSIKLIKSIGFTKEGFSKKRLYLRGKWLDMILFAAHSEDFGIPWKPLKQKPSLRF